MKTGLLFLLIIWNSNPVASENTINRLQFSLGCKAVIPCHHDRGDSNSFRWFYSRDERSHKIRLFFQDKTGVKYHRPHSPVKIQPNGSLVIDDLTDDDQGHYWCESCFQDRCQDEQHTIISVKKREIRTETNETVYVREGNGFTRACPGEFPNLKWTFEANNLAQTPESYVTFNKSVHIVNVKKANAGKYTCWTSGCDGHRQRLLTINLCVMTVHHRDDSSVSCTVMCDMDVRSISAPNMEVDTKAMFVDVKCNTMQPFDGYSEVNSSHGSSNVSNKTTDLATEHEHLAYIYGTSATLTCLILMTLLICCIRPRLRGAFPVHPCCCGSNCAVEEETSVVYSSFIRRPANTTNSPMADCDCVYSEIRI